ncbi:unnamed protein product [Angiostrongylus costaricensis]|uniref:Reverse transcriptase domain-containing protein n=1 Tax=Angiostrongylus costaricensis TaxID=334426 RepID=A0A0R3PQH3_ANGCS|nr:unnamed protein product [Angiostrongylus costaricensis]
MRTLELDNMGVKIDGRQLRHLRFDDDIVLIVPNISQAERMLAGFDKACRKIGLRLNLTKTMFKRITPNAPVVFLRIFVEQTRVAGVDVMMMPHCVIVGNTVTALCNAMPAPMMCQLDNAMMIGSIPVRHLSISGSLTTTNVIMANWSREMWQGVVNRAVRMLASGPFGTNFASAFATVN